MSSSFEALLVDGDGFEVVAGVGGDGWGGDGTGSCGVELFGDVVGEEIGVNAEGFCWGERFCMILRHRGGEAPLRGALHNEAASA